MSPVRRHAFRRRAAAAAVVAALAPTACSTSGASSTGDKGYIAGDGAVTVFAEAERDPAPMISGDAVGEGRVALADFTGQVTVLNVWGSWCAPCRAEADDLAAAAAALPDTAFVGLNTRDVESAALAFERAQQTPYRSLFDPSGESLLRFYGLVNPASLPSTVVIDSEGRVAALISGPATKITLVDLVHDIGGDDVSS